MLLESPSPTAPQKDVTFTSSLPGQGIILLLRGGQKVILEKLLFDIVLFLGGGAWFSL